MMAPDSQRVRLVFGSVIACCRNQQTLPFILTNTEAILSVLTRHTTVWIDIDEWWLFDVLKTHATH